MDSRKLSRVWLVTILVLALFTAVASPAGARTVAHNPAEPHPQSEMQPPAPDSLIAAREQAERKISPALLASPGHAPESTQVIVYAKPDADLSAYLDNAIALRYVDPLGNQRVIGALRPGALMKLASLPEVTHIASLGQGVAPPAEIDLSRTVPPEVVQARIAAFRSQASNIRSIPEPAAMPSVRSWWTVGPVHRSAEAWANGYTGDGVKVLIADTGVDWCHPDLVGTWATIEDPTSPYFGWPEMFDSASMYLYALDLFYGQTNVADGLTDYADTSATCAAGSPCSYQPIGAAEAHNYTLPATSQSGVYHIGSHPDTLLEDLWYGERVAVLVADEASAGEYDSVYVDLDGDFDFSDETPATRDMPIACLDAYDSTTGQPGADGYNDLSGGLVYFIADGSTPIPTSEWAVYPFVPENGSLVAFSVDSGSHGTFVASAVAGQGVINGMAQPYQPPYTGPGSGLIRGAGKDVKLSSVGDNFTAPSLDYPALFAALGYDGIPGSGDDFQIANHSWGSRNLAYDGMDDYLTRSYEETVRSLDPTVAHVFAAGNGGPGYGTLDDPNPPSSIQAGGSIGAGASSVEYDPTNYGGLPAFSITSTEQIVWGDVWSGSSRGPGGRGDSGIDVNADAGWNPSSLVLNLWGDGWTSWINGGATSNAAPTTSGNLALVYDAYRQANGVWPDAQTARAILKSGAQEQQNDTLAQGAGLVDALASTDIASGRGGFYVTPDEWTAGDYHGAVHPAFANIQHPGTSKAGVFTVHNPGPDPISVALITDQLTRSWDTELSFTSADQSLEDALHLNYLIDITDILTSNCPPDACNLVQIHAVSEQIRGVANGWEFMAYFWTDVNGDGNLWTDDNGDGVVQSSEIDPGEYALAGYDWNAGAPSLALQLRRPLDPMHDGVFLGLWHHYKSPAVPTTTFQISIEAFQHEEWPWLSLNPALLDVPAGGSATFEAAMTVPPDAPIGIASGAIKVAGDDHTATVPVVANVAAQGTDFTVGSTPPAAAMYDSGRVSSDWDWRLYFFDAPENPPNGAKLLIHNQWADPLPTRMEIGVYGPAEDDFSNADPDYYGPYTIDPVGGSSGSVLAETEDWVVSPLASGLHFLSERARVFSGAQFAAPFTATISTANVTPSEIDLETMASHGSVDVTFTAGLDLDGLVAQGYGMAVPEFYPGLPIMQDDPGNPMTASYTRTLTLQDAGKLKIATGNAPGNDIDLFLLYDANSDGEFDWNSELLAYSWLAGSDELIELTLPPDGDYMIACQGYDVPAGASTFDLSVTAIQGLGLAASGLPSGPVPAGTTVTIQVDYTVDLVPGAMWHGLVFVGPPSAPAALEIPVTITVGQPPVVRSRRYNVAQDSYLNETRPALVFGTNSTMWVGHRDTLRPVVYANIPVCEDKHACIPPNSTVDTAYLYVYVTEGRGYTNWEQSLIADVSVHPVMAGWDEASATWTTPWSNAGGDLGPALDSIHLGSGKVGTWLRFDVTDHVAAIVAGDAENHGFALTSSDPGWVPETPDAISGVRYGLATHEYWDPWRVGYLRVMYRTYTEFAE